MRPVGTRRQDAEEAQECGCDGRGHFGRLLGEIHVDLLGAVRARVLLG
jgi:hypothetical protein